MAPIWRECILPFLPPQSLFSLSATCSTFLSLLQTQDEYLACRLRSRFEFGTLTIRQMNAFVAQAQHPRIRSCERFRNEITMIMQNMSQQYLRTYIRLALVLNIQLLIAFTLAVLNLSRYRTGWLITGIIQLVGMYIVWISIGLVVPAIPRQDYPLVASFGNAVFCMLISVFVTDNTDVLSFIGPQLLAVSLFWTQRPVMPDAIYIIMVRVILPILPYHRRVADLAEVLNPAIAAEMRAEMPKLLTLKEIGTAIHETALAKARRALTYWRWPRGLCVEARALALAMGSATILSMLAWLQGRFTISGSMVLFAVANYFV
eukprot:NODE_1204_length_1836_cov_79.719206_g1142_i0.p1 GENE.NODE_1204_length_1836_cov_79.719206_g1142_i0~~NODE_1204_length_1836_cov_79.719206_g1142_i0.p1  ORF type:complete len:318 (-),score=31.70 NODE_1204_length_1836_cov_79.719206_g1142_i0:81-1034(-)